MEKKNPYCGWCSLMIFPYEERIHVTERERDYHPTCFDKQVRKEQSAKQDVRMLRKNP